MIISISGKPGSGKSTLGKMLAEKLGYQHYYVGGMRRFMARERGLTLEELNALGEREGWTDKEVDEYQKELAAREDNFVIEGRTSFYFIPSSLKIFINVSPEEGARRVYLELQDQKNTRNEAKNLDSIEDVLESHKKRITSDALRYKKYYGIDIEATSPYDLVLDSTDLTIDQAFEKLYAFVAKRLQNQKK